MYKKVYEYICGVCKKKRQSFNPEVARLKHCMKCKRTAISPNQTNIFDAVAEVGDKSVESGDK